MNAPKTTPLQRSRSAGMRVGLGVAFKLAAGDDFHPENAVGNKRPNLSRMWSQRSCLNLFVD